MFILFFLIQPSSFSQRTSEWEKLTSPTSDLLRKIFFVDSKNGWAAGITGTIVQTTNGGDSWALQNSTVVTPIVDIFFINKHYGWALTYPQVPPFGTSILKTTNGGANWFADSIFFENEIMSTIFFFDDSIGFVGGNGIKKTTNGGLSWVDAEIDSGTVSTLPVSKFSFFSKTFGYASGGRLDIAGVIWKTTDGGNSWSSIGLSPDQIFDVFVFDSLNALALSGDPEELYAIALIRTNDGGLTWDFTELPLFGLSFAIDFIDEKVGWSASGYKFLLTGDGGKTWVEELTPDSTTVYDLQFVDKYTGFACGENGVLLKFTSFNKPVLDKPVFELLQNHPNPFTDKTTFGVSAITPNFDIPSRAQIKLFDVLGNEILTLIDQDFSSGIYEFTFYPKQTNISLSSGVYILTLFSDQKIYSRKIVYLK